MTTRTTRLKRDRTKITSLGELEGQMERIFDAPPDRVFAAHSDPEAIPQWWGPSDLTTEVATLDFRVGGAWRFVQRDGEGNVHAFHGDYREIVPNKRIVTTFVYEGAPDKVIVESYTFDALAGARTLLRVHSRFPDRETLDQMTAAGMEEGARETWERLARHVTKQNATSGEATDLLMVRTIDATPEAVYAALTDEKHIGEWWGPAGFRTTTHSMDVREGGHWQHTMHGPDGTDYPNFIRYTAVEPNRRLAWEHGQTPDGPVLFRASIDIEPAGDQTIVRLRHHFPTQAERDAVVKQHGAIEGGYDTLAHLAEVVER